MLKNTLPLVLVLLAAPAWAQFHIPNAADAFAADQAEVDSVDLDILAAGLAGMGVVSGCAVTAQASPDMTLAVASGSVKIGSTVASVSAGNVTITAAHATLARFDLVVVNDSGTKSVTAGTASSNPSFPAIPASSVVLAAVYVPAADTTIESNHITDKRVILSGAVGTALTSGRVPYATTGGVLTDDADLTFDSGTNMLTVGRSYFTDYAEFASNNYNRGVIGVASSAVAFDGAGLTWVAANTPDAPQMLTGTTSNSWHLSDYGDRLFDFQNGPCGAVACADPTFIIHSHNQSTSQYLALSHNGSTAQINTTAGLYFNASTAYFNLTSGSGGIQLAGAANGLWNGTSNWLVGPTGYQTQTTGLGLWPGTANYALLAEYGDQGFNFAHAAATDPTLFIHSHNQSTTQYGSLQHDGTNFRIGTGTGSIFLIGNVWDGGAGNYFGSPNASTTGLAFMPEQSSLTPDSGILLTGTTANSVHVAEFGDNSFDFQNGPCGTSACTDPSLIVHSHNQATNQWISVSHNGTSGRIIAPVFVLQNEAVTSGIESDVGNSRTVYRAPQDHTFYAGGLTKLVMLPGSVPVGGLAGIPATTPDALGLLTDTLSNSVHLMENADAAFDFNNGPAGTAAATNPQLIVHDKDQNTTNYQALGLSGLSGSFRVTLTESSATAVVQVPVASSAGTGGFFGYCIFAADATDQQQRCSEIRFAVSNKAGTETCGMTALAGAADASILETEDGNAASISAGTLTYTIACDTSPTNAVNLTVNAVSSLTQTTLEARGQVRLIGPGEPLPQ
jgi:hypothetical protein